MRKPRTSKYLKVEVVPHHPNWKAQFQSQAQIIKQAMGSVIINIHHIGSTSISTIYAKPIIDFLIEVSDLQVVDQKQFYMENLGYEAMGENGIEGRRFFRKNKAPDVRSYNVHMFEANTHQVKRHLAFRDYLRTHPQEAQEYSQLKRTLAQQFPRNIYAYMDGKDELIKRLEQQALEWYQG